LDMHNLKGRIAHDIDILVPPAKVAPALAILDDGGWCSTRGESGLLLRRRGAAFRSINLVKPPFGDIDLHTRAYLTVSRDSPPDRLVNAIAHGVLDAHRHSDWLVDCAQVVAEGAIDWPLVVMLAEDLGTPAQVTLALFYLRE